MKSKGVRLVLKTNFMLHLFHQSAEVLYEKNIEEAEQWPGGVFQLASLYFGTLNSHAALEVVSCVSINIKLNVFRKYFSMTRILVINDQIFGGQSMMDVITAFG